MKIHCAHAHAFRSVVLEPSDPQDSLMAALSEAAALRQEVGRLREGLERATRLIVEHHAIGSMKKLEWGGECPVCTKRDPGFFSETACLLAEHPTTEGWRDIESAPKDGRRVVRASAP